MNQYNLNAEEIAKVIDLYSKIPTYEKRLFAQGYLHGLGSSPFTLHPEENERTTQQIHKENGKQTA